MFQCIILCTCSPPHSCAHTAKHGVLASNSDLVAAVAHIKADGARRSPADVLTQLQLLPEWASVTISQVRRAISAAPKVDAQTKANRRVIKERERDTRRRQDQKAAASMAEEERSNA